MPWLHTFLGTSLLGCVLCSALSDQETAQRHSPKPEEQQNVTDIGTSRLLSAGSDQSISSWSFSETYSSSASAGVGVGVRVGDGVGMQRHWRARPTAIVDVSSTLAIGGDSLSYAKCSERTAAIVAAASRVDGEMGKDDISIVAPKTAVAITSLACCSSTPSLSPSCAGERRLIICGDNRGVIRVFSRATGALLQTIEATQIVDGSEAPITSISVSDDGRRIAFASASGLSAVLTDCASSASVLWSGRGDGAESKIRESKTDQEDYYGYDELAKEHEREKVADDEEKEGEEKEEEEEEEEEERRADSKEDKPWLGRQPSFGVAILPPQKLPVTGIGSELQKNVDLQQAVAEAIAVADATLKIFVLAADAVDSVGLFEVTAKAQEAKEDNTGADLSECLKVPITQARVVRRFVS